MSNRTVAILCVVFLTAISLITFLLFPKPQPVKLQTRVFKVDKAAFYTAIENVNHSRPNEADDAQTVSLAVRKFFKTVGVDLNTTGRSVAFNDKQGLLFVKATASELDLIERSVQALSRVAPQIHVKARFIEVPQDSLKTIWKAGTVVAETETNTIEIISSDKFKPLLRQLQNGGTETLAEPEVVTPGGRQTQMRATEIAEILLASTNKPQLTKFELGPTIDIVPDVLADNSTINLTVIPEVLQFLGYDNTTSSSPGFRVEETAAHMKLWDNQTVIIGNLKSKFIGYANGAQTTNESKFFADAEKNSSVTNKSLVIFITATIVDPAGNRVNSENELRIAEKKSAIPPQN